MAARIESATTIARPVEDVFQFLLDLDQHPTEAFAFSPALAAKNVTAFRTRAALPDWRDLPLQFASDEPTNGRFVLHGSPD